MKSCRNCGRRSNEKNRYCPYCGAPLVNRCTNDGGLIGDPCRKTNPDDAAFCTSCGSHTAFYRAGLLPGAGTEFKTLETDETAEWNLFQHPFFDL